jgi:predicted nucleic acid-binding protein
VIVFDTNVLSEPLRRDPEPGVLRWIAAQTDVAVSSISVGELFRGAFQLPVGTRRTALLAHVESTLAKHADRILAYDGQAARAYAVLHEKRRSIGHPLAVEDGMIAASALVHGAALATRNVSDFAHLGVEVIDPWRVVD